jgi:antitoxin HigA-1
MPRIRSHPGEILKEEFMIPHGLSALRLAELPVPEGAEAGMSP